MKSQKRFSNLDADKKIQAKISYMMDKGKRNLDVPALKNSRQRYQDNFIRSKRDLLNEKVQPQESADDPRSPEHIKLLEESFPNPAENTFLKQDDSLVRVKRDNL